MEEQKPNERNSFNPFSSAETPSNSYAGQSSNPAENSSNSAGHSNPPDFSGQAHSASSWDAPTGASVNEAASRQAQFPRFNNAKLDPSGAAAGTDDIRKRMEDAKSNGWGTQIGGFFTAHKVHIAIGLAIVALFAAGSYMSRSNEPNDRTASNTAAISQQTIQDNQDSNVFDIKLDDRGTVILENAQDATGLLPDSQEGSSITKTAQAGDGITHLARSALVDYLSQNEKSLSREQKIYAEDYVQNMTGDEWLDIGQKLSFSLDLLKDAVREAEGLADWQIENLKQYTATVSLL